MIWNGSNGLSTRSDRGFCECGDDCWVWFELGVPWPAEYQRLLALPASSFAWLLPVHVTGRATDPSLLVCIQQVSGPIQDFIAFLSPTYFINHIFTRAVWRVRRLTSLLRVGTLWRCGDGLFSEVPPLASDVILTTLHLLLENVLQTVDYFEISCLGAPFSWLEKPRNCMGARSELYGGCFNGVPLIHFLQTGHRIQFRSRPVRFLGFSNHENGAPRQEISRRSTVCSTFSRSGWSVVSSSLAREVLRKGDRYRTFTKFRLGVIRWVHELCKRPSYNNTSRRC
jgi:hypothetical protein